MVWTHKSCVCNEKVALSLRHQIDTGDRYATTLDLRSVLKPWIEHVSPVSPSVIIRHATSRKRLLLEQALESLKGEELSVKDAKVRMFLKDDKYHEWKPVAPRCIQYRGKRYALSLACYLHPIEQMVYGWTDLSGTPIFAKSRNLTQRGHDIADKMSYFQNPVAISLDHSKFDAHVNMSLLDLEHWFYKQCNRSPKLKMLLHWQRVNHGQTKNGTKYVTRATRMSGDQNTGIGNSIINYAMTKALLEKLKIRHCLYIDGDDFLVICERIDAGKFDPSLYKQFGMATKLDSITGVIEHIDFCQCRPVFNGSGYTMVRDPYRMLQRIQWAVGKKHPRHVVNYLTSIGKCMIALGMGLPVEQYIGSTLSNLGGKYITTEQTMMANKMFMRPSNARVVECCEASRASYEQAWGFTAGQQLILERLSIGPPVLEDLVPFLQYGSEETVTEGIRPFSSSPIGSVY